MYALLKRFGASGAFLYLDALAGKEGIVQKYGHHQGQYDSVIQSLFL
jgi:hypothetical protein